MISDQLRTEESLTTLRNFLSRVPDPRLNLTGTALAGLGFSLLLLSKVIEVHQAGLGLVLIGGHYLGLVAAIASLVWLFRSLDRAPQEVLPRFFLAWALILMILHISTGEWFTVVATSFLVIGLGLMIWPWNKFRV